MIQAPVHYFPVFSTHLTMPYIHRVVCACLQKTQVSMGRLILFLLFVFHSQVAILGSLTSSRHLCTPDNSLLLLQFKQSINIDDAASLGCESNGIPSYPKTTYWNKSTDCCRWDGVTCDEFTGQVIDLNLSCSQFQGVIDSNTTLFQLSHLQTLNLAYNDFSSSGISSNFDRLRSLTHLNLSSSGFSGSLPSEFLNLFNLVSLDLSLSEGEIIIQPHIFKSLLQNSTQLREVYLTGVNIASRLPRNLSASLLVLKLGDTNLIGKLPVEIFEHPNLHTLQLYDNFHLTGSLPKVEWNTSSALRYLDLSSTGFFGELPESIGNLRSLYHLELSFCKFSRPIPESLGNLTKMTSLILLYNNFSGQVPSSLASLQQLVELDLSSNSLEGQLPNCFSNFKNLTQLTLNDNLFNGYFPSSIINLTKLEVLNLSNNSLTGPLPPKISGFSNLVFLFLADNLFNSTIPSWIFSLPSLRYLDMTSNQLTGQLYEFQYQSLQRIYLSGNKLHGPIPTSISKLVNLTDLDLAHNNFSGDVEVSWFSNLKLLEFVSLSNNSLVLTTGGVNSTLPESLNFLYLSLCSLKDLDSINGASNLARLDVSHNMLQGHVFFEKKWYVWNQSLIYLDISHNFLTQMNQLPFENLFFLDLRYNLLQGSMLIPPITTKFFFTSDNNFTGEILPSMCKLSSLMVLDVSNNNLSGVIPQCLLTMSKELSVLDMHGNRFHGKIPGNHAVGSNLRILNLRNNQLEGTLPRSLSECRELEVLDIGNNNLNDTFPRWLGTLPKLKVLSLRANNLHGPASFSSTPLSLSALRILDLSNNALTGVLPSATFEKLRGMKRKDDREQLLTYIGDQSYQYSIVMITKGVEINFVRILSIFTTMDLSNNNFDGHIPDAIGDLISLRGLNLSHNNLAGPIPPVLGNLKVLESLDLSSNQIEGQIPQQLATLSYLAVFNVSYNHLGGRIPGGQQFNTFGNNSYIGNPGLCGFPMSKNCRANELPPPPAPILVDYNEEIFNGFTWKAVLIGYVCGMVIGASIGCLIFITGKPEWFYKIVQKEGSRWVRRKWPKEVKWQ